LATVLHENGRSRLLVDRHDDVLEVLERAHVAAAADHELGAGKLEQPAADLAVALLDGVDERRERDL
jgi:hypothetical protein